MIGKMTFTKEHGVKIVGTQIRAFQHGSKVIIGYNPKSNQWSFEVSHELGSMSMVGRIELIREGIYIATDIHLLDSYLTLDLSNAIDTIANVLGL